MREVKKFERKTPIAMYVKCSNCKTVSKFDYHKGVFHYYDCWKCKEHRFFTLLNYIYEEN